MLYAGKVYSHRHIIDAFDQPFTLCVLQGTLLMRTNFCEHSWNPIHTWVWNPFRVMVSYVQLVNTAFTPGIWFVSGLEHDLSHDLVSTVTL